MTLPPAAHATIYDALAEDLGEAGDVTSAATVSAGAVAEATVVARDAGTIAGLDVAAQVFAIVDDELKWSPEHRDGEAVAAGTVVATASGRTRSLLTAERTALNFLGHLSGIATETRRYVDAVAGTGARIVDTRKTTPGLRSLEKMAVRSGGAGNHRFGLYDAVLIKDNHIAAAGSAGDAVRAARAATGHTMTIEVEVETLDQLRDALAAGPDVVMLDNMDLATMRRAVSLVDGSAVVEASGGIGIDQVRSVALTGVDVISIGRITHSAPALDVALELRDP